MSLPNSFLQHGSRNLYNIQAVQHVLFHRLLLAFLAFGLPAALFGIYVTLQRGAPGLAMLFGLFFVLALLDMLLAERLTFGVAAGFLVLLVFALSIVLLCHLGLYGAGIPLAIVCCGICMSFFDMRRTALLVAAYVALFILIAIGVVRGVIPMNGTIPDPSLSTLSWIGMIMDFLMMVSPLVLIQQVLHEHIEQDMDRIKKDGMRLTETNHMLREENASRRAAEEALRLSEEHYRLMVENAHDAVFIGQDGLVKFPNRRALQLVGYSAEEIAATPFSHFIHPEDRARVMDNYSRRLQGEDIPSLYSLRLLSKSGETVWIDLSAALFSWEDRPAVLYSARDVTAQKKLEAVTQRGQRLEVVGTLTGGIAHDFNNLLQVIQGYAELLAADMPADSRGRQELMEIRQAAVQGGNLARQLLSFSRKIESSLQPMDLNETVRKIEHLLRRVLPRMIRIDLRLSPELKNVNADAGQMEQVLLNLAINARDAMPQGGVLTVETENTTLDEESCRPYPDLRAGPHVLLRVSDTGQGIAPEDLPRIFEPFYTTKDVDKGTGLGLAMVYGIIRNHNGIVSCRSAPGAGACFTIRLPAIVSGLPALISPDQAPPPRGTETILLVDDEDSIRSLEERILRGAGYSVLTAVDGEHALETYRAGPAGIHLVILDLVMPGMGGRKCLAELLAINPDVRVIVASGFLPDEPEADVVSARGCIHKPFEINAMLEEVRRVLDDAAPPGGNGKKAAAALNIQTAVPAAGR